MQPNCGRVTLLRHQPRDFIVVGDIMAGHLRMDRLKKLVPCVKKYVPITVELEPS